MDVRPAEADDADGMAAVAEDAWWAACAGFLDAEAIRRIAGEHYTDERMAEAAADDDLGTFVAVEDEVVGFAVAEQTWADTVDLHALYVDPERWGEGAGTALLDAVLAWAREREVDYLRASVFTDNHVGTAFFEGRGFERRKTATTEVFATGHEEGVYERSV